MHPPPTNLRSVFGTIDRGSGPGLPGRLESDYAGIKWTAKAPELAAAIAKLLDIDVPDILVAAWNKSDEIREALADSAREPGSKIEVHLFDYAAHVTLEPYLEIRVASIPRGQRITVTVDLPIRLKGVVLGIEAGRIAGILAGSCDVSGTVKYKELKIAELVEPITVPLGSSFALAPGKTAG